MEHAAPHMLLEPWRIELHTPSLRRTDAALEHEAPSRKIQNVNLPVRSWRYLVWNPRESNPTIDHAMVNRLLGTWGPSCMSGIRKGPGCLVATGSLSNIKQGNQRCNSTILPAYAKKRSALANCSSHAMIFNCRVCISLSFADKFSKVRLRFQGVLPEIPCKISFTLERRTGLEPATVCLEGRYSTN